jgi:hypothetical protein
MCVDETGLIFYLVYEFERLRLLPGLDRSISNNCSSSNRTNNARAGFAPDELLGSGTTQPRPCIISSNTFATDKGRCDRSLARSAWGRVTPKEPSRRVRCDSRRCAHQFDDRSDGPLRRAAASDRRRPNREDFVGCDRLFVPHFDTSHLAFFWLILKRMV